MDYAIVPFLEDLSPANIMANGLLVRVNSNPVSYQRIATSSPYEIRVVMYDYTGGNNYTFMFGSTASVTADVYNAYQMADSNTGMNYIMHADISTPYNGMYYADRDSIQNVGYYTGNNGDIPGYSNISDAKDAITGSVLYPITYRLTNATTTGPDEAAVGDTVTVPLTFSEGYGVVNPSSDAYVTCNGVLVPSTYSNGQLVFTMPDPS